jgi:hypothetical protein
MGKQGSDFTPNPVYIYGRIFRTRFNLPFLSGRKIVTGNLKLMVSTSRRKMRFFRRSTFCV